MLINPNNVFVLYRLTSLASNPYLTDNSRHSPHDSLDIQRLTIESANSFKVTQIAAIKGVDDKLALAHVDGFCAIDNSCFFRLHDSVILMNVWHFQESRH